MAIRNAKLGGSDFIDGEVLNDYDLDDTFNAVAFRSLAVNSTPVTATASRLGSSGSGTTTDSQTMTVTIPASAITRFIVVVADISAESTSVGNTGSSASGNGRYTVIKDSGTPADLQAIRTLAQSGSIIDIDRDRDNNAVYTYIYYEPTAGEMTSGFDIDIDLVANATTNADTGSNASATITCNNLRIMGV